MIRVWNLGHASLVRHGIGYLLTEVVLLSLPIQVLLFSALKSFSTLLFCCEVCRAVFLILIFDQNDA